MNHHSLTTDQSDNQINAALQECLDPLRRYWPRIHAEVFEACTRGYPPSRVGEILAFCFLQMIEDMGNGNEDDLQITPPDSRLER